MSPSADTVAHNAQNIAVEALSNKKAPTPEEILTGVLDEITEWVRKYIVFPTEHGYPVLALWAVHTHVSGSFYTTPRLILSSPVAGSGKTRVLELLQHVSYNPRLTTSSSTAAIFRRIGKSDDDGQLPPTLLYDETDALFTGKPSEQSEDLRALFNSGYKRGATVDRCVGENNDVKEFPVFSPVALAGLAGHMPDTITTRAITIEMKKRKKSEKVSPYRARAAANEISEVLTRLELWADAPGVAQALSEADPNLPEGVEDRPAEVWEPLVAIADMAGKEWAKAAREACTSFVFAPEHKPPPVGLQLLADIREVMGHGTDTECPRVDAIRTGDLLFKLNNLEESGWADHGVNGLDARGLSRFMSAYSVGPTDFRDASGKWKGYTIKATSGKRGQAGLMDAWDRYLPDVRTPPPQSGDNGDNGDSAGQSVANRPQSVPTIGDSPQPGTTPGTENMPLTSGVPNVPNVPDLQGKSAPVPDETTQTMARHAVLEAVAEYPQTIEQIKKSVTRTYRDQALQIVPELVAAGTVHDHGDNTYSKN